MKQIILITGASSGIGEACVKQLDNGENVIYATARRLNVMKHLENANVHIRMMDVTDEDSIKAVVNEIIENQGRIDVLVNNAGYGSYGALEDVSMDEARMQFDVNVFGLAQITQLVLPYMRENKYGKIVNISSIGGKVHEAFGSWYHASKYAVEGLSDCLRVEVKPFGIDVVVIEPGMIETNWSSIARDSLLEASKDGAYKDIIKKDYGFKKASKPIVIARAVEKSITARKPKTRYVVGEMAKISIFGRWLFSDRIMDRMSAFMTMEKQKK